MCHSHLSRCFPGEATTSRPEHSILGGRAKGDDETGGREPGLLRVCSGSIDFAIQPRARHANSEFVSHFILSSSQHHPLTSIRENVLIQLWPSYTQDLITRKILKCHPIDIIWRFLERSWHHCSGENYLLVNLVRHVIIWSDVCPV